MKDFAGRLAVVTGGGAGMGRELACQLVAAGCNVAMCDISAKSIAETERLCGQNRQGARVTAHVANVSDEVQVLRFRDEVAREHATDKVHLLFNNAGIAGGGSLFANSRAQWERTFNICWGGVYLCTRAFLPMLVNADEGHIVNVSSVNRFWASLGAGRAAYRVLRGEIRREGLYRGADRRSRRACAARQMLRRHAGAHRHLDRLQFPQGPL